MGVALCNLVSMQYFWQLSPNCSKLPVIPLFSSFRGEKCRNVQRDQVVPKVLCSIGSETLVVPCEIGLTDRVWFQIFTTLLTYRPCFEWLSFTHLLCTPYRLLLWQYTVCLTMHTTERFNCSEHVSWPCISAKQCTKCKLTWGSRSCLLQSGHQLLTHGKTYATLAQMLGGSLSCKSHTPAHCSASSSFCRARKCKPLQGCNKLFRPHCLTAWVTLGCWSAGKIPDNAPQCILHFNTEHRETVIERKACTCPSIQHLACLSKTSPAGWKYNIMQLVQLFQAGS